MKQKLKLLVLAFSVVGFIVAGIFSSIDRTRAAGYGPGNLIINEFTASGTTWIELMNTTASDIDLSASTWEFVFSPHGAPGPSTTTLSGLVPANGMLTISASLLGGPVLTDLLIYWNGSNIYHVSYGPGGDVAAPSVGESAILISTSTWSTTSSISKGWFNETTSTLNCSTPPAPGPGVTPPSLDAIVSCLPSGVTTNMNNTGSISDPTRASNLWFEKTGSGKINYSSALNLTDQNTRTLLQNLGTKMELEDGRVRLDASTALIMKNAGATLYFYGLNDLGYNNIGTGSILVKDDAGAVIPTSSVDYPDMTGASWSSTNSGTLQFDAEHFSEYDVNPVITEITPVASPSYTATPTYVFSANVTGTVIYGGDCVMAAASTTNGNNSVVFGPLSDGTHSNCTVKVIDGAGASTTLAVTSFATITNPPSTPVGLSAAPVSASEIDLTWTATTGTNYYNIYRGTVSTSLSVVASTTNNYKNNTGLANNTLFYYKVSAVNGIGEGASSSLVSTTTLPLAAPNVPIGLSAVGTSTSMVQVSWTASTDTPDYYNVYHGTDGVAYSFVASTTDPIYYHDSLGVNTIHYYKVSAVNNAGETTSTADNAYTFAAVPSGLTTTASTTVATTLQWSANGNPAGTVYQISGTGFATATTTATSTAISSLNPDTSYTFDLLAKNGDNILTAAVSASDWTKAVNPSSFVSTASSTVSISLSWSGGLNPGTTIYQLFGIGFATTSVTATSDIVSGLNPNAHYTFNVRSQNHDGTYNAPQSVSDDTTVAVPGTPTATPTSSTQIILSWDPSSNPGTTVYQVYNVTTAAVSGTTTATSLTVGGLTTNTAYEFKVRAQNLNDGSWSAYSGISTAATTFALPTVTSGDVSSVASTTATFNGNITFIGGTNATERGFTYGTTTGYGTTSTASGSFGTGAFTAPISALSAGTNYHYKAYTKNSVGTSFGSDILFTTVFAPTAGNPTTTIGVSNTATNTIIAGTDVVNPVINMSSVTTGGAGTVPGEIDATVGTSIGDIIVTIPDGTTISGASWNGVIHLPTIKSNSSVSVTADSGYTATVDSVIEIGFDNTALTFDRGVRILIPGKASKYAGYYRNSTFTKITATCSADNQAAGDALLAGTDCRTTSGSDLVIWTKHFTSFLTYTQQVQQSGGSSGGGINNNNQTAPTNASVVINSGSASTASANVTLALSASDATQMAISNTSDFNGISWEDYAASKSWVLPAGAGLKTIYVKFRNADGNISNIVSDSIDLTVSAGGATPEEAATGEIGVAESPDSAVAISNIVAAEYQPGNSVGFSYEYKNETEKTLYVKIMRELVNSKGKVIKKLTAYRTIKAGSVFKADIKELLSSNLASGLYTMRVKIYNSRTNKLLAQNSFKIMVKNKNFVFSSLPEANAIAFNTSTFNKMKKVVLLPATVTLRYSYTNLTETKQTIKMVRELIDPSGKTLAMRTGKWVMVPGEKDSVSLVQSLAKKLSVGDYKLRVRALDYKTGEILAENAVDFKIELR
ncbi:MAG: fibronectin type III domain-containing protein [Candidatus Magasanikbacteria bacterium]|nr:fibronectin type III domain-containing protein [Candidatus Magasanikbacteria bacterium]